MSTQPNQPATETQSMNPYEKWMPEARQLAAQCWCDEETKHMVMDDVLAEAVAKRIAAWMTTAADCSNHTEFYRDIVIKIGETFGVAAKTSDDGSIQQDVLALKVPELVAALQAQVEAAKAAVEALESVVEAGQYIVEITHHAADPKNMNTTDWKGIALHMYAAMNVLPAARISLARCAAAGLTNNQTTK